MEATGKYHKRGFIGESNTRVIFGEFLCVSDEECLFAINYLSLIIHGCS